MADPEPEPRGVVADYNRTMIPISKGVVATTTVLVAVFSAMGFVIAYPDEMLFLIAMLFAPTIWLFQEYRRGWLDSPSPFPRTVRCGLIASAVLFAIGIAVGFLTLRMAFDELPESKRLVAKSISMGLCLIAHYGYIFFDGLRWPPSREKMPDGGVTVHESVQGN